MKSKEIRNELSNAIEEAQEDLLSQPINANSKEVVKLLRQAAQHLAPDYWMVSRDQVIPEIALQLYYCDGLELATKARKLIRAKPLANKGFFQRFFDIWSMSIPPKN